MLLSHVGVTVLHSILIEPSSMTHVFPLINRALALALPLHSVVFCLFPESPFPLKKCSFRWNVSVQSFTIVAFLSSIMHYH